MRIEYGEQLESVNRDLFTMCELVGVAIEQATEALLTGDLAKSEFVIAADDRIDELNARIEAESLTIAALQAPVATDLRLVLGSIRMAASLERMGDLAAHIAKQVRLRHPKPAIPIDLHPTFARMGTAAKAIVEATGEVVATRDTDLASVIRRYDDTLDELHRGLFAAVLSQNWTHGVEAAIDVTLLSRFYERFGDHAVTVARRIKHVATGDQY